MWSSWRRFSAWMACQSSASMLARLLLSEDMELRLRDERRAILACTNLVPECGLARQKNLVTDGLITRLYPLPRFRPSARSGHCALRAPTVVLLRMRSEERRVGKEGRFSWSACH